MNKNKIMASLLAFVMMLSVFAPSFAYASETAPAAPAMELKKEDVVGSFNTEDIQTEKPEKTNLTINKLVADEYNNGVPVDHNGGKLEKEKLDKLGTNVKGLAGVKFTIYKVNKESDFESIKEVSPKTKEEMQQYVTQGKATLVKETQATVEDGSVTEQLDDGNYWVIESDRPTSVTSSIAVPFGITLPLLNQVKVGNHEAGTVYLKNVHIYPKNIEKKPQMDKGFAKNNEEIDSKMLKEWQDTYGPEYNKYLEKKDEIDARVGSKIPYEVKTSLKQGQIYKTLSWSDIMTEGLKYNKDLKIIYKSSAAESQEQTVEIKSTSTKTETDYGFDVTIKDENTIKAINEALTKGDVEFTLTYTATVTRDAVVDMPESNNITFTPGEPKHKNNKNPISPTEGSITVTKSWAKGKAPEGVLITYILFEGEKPVASVTLKGTEIQSKSLAEGMSVANDGYNVTFKGLDNQKKYKVEEFANGYDPEYSSATGVKNIANPDRITPTPPQVVVGGKKFVKTDSKDTRLAGAEFVVKNSEDKYLVAKTGEQIAAQQKDVTDAKAALDKAIEEYNKLSSEKQTKEERSKIDELQKKYNKAVKAAGNVYEWGEKNNALVLVSDGQGRFEITGLAFGEYKLEEIKAPLGFAKLEKDIEFTVSKDSYKQGGTISYESEKPTQDAMKIENKKVTIPQTGGIGTIIFTVAGLAIMGGAFYVMKKNNEEEEA